MPHPPFPAKHPIPVTQDERESFEKTTACPQKRRLYISNGPSQCSDSLSFERVANGDLQYPLTKREFLDYLIYIYGSAENFQFWTWYRDYEVRFKAASSQLNLALNSVYSGTTNFSNTPELVSDDGCSGHTSEDGVELRIQDTRRAIVSTVSNSSDPFATPPCTPAVKDFDVGKAPPSLLYHQLVPKTSLRSLTPAEAQTLSDPEYDDLRPFSEEKSRVVATYIITGSRRQLILPVHEQKQLIAADTAHPDVFRSTFTGVDLILRKKAHPAFISWSKANCTEQRMWALKSLGALVVLFSLILALLLVLSNVRREWRLLAVPGFFSGSTMTLCAYRRLCVFLYASRLRHAPPWEQFLDEEMAQNKNTSSDTPFGPSNTFGDEIWKERYESRTLWQKIFDKTVTIQEPALARAHDMTVLQCVVVALLIGGAASGILMAIPRANLY
ncbi:uncharacterized protein BROUX77_003556 [Berkeleyomyces rouxiae]|uniref:uncharacterized protein n=1 Tax=Berkeleyomyces rouxiae TaxID=2035830 RepID=UPI003B8248AB